MLDKLAVDFLFRYSAVAWWAHHAESRPGHAHARAATWGVRHGVVTAKAGLRAAWDGTFASDQCVITTSCR